MRNKDAWLACLFVAALALTLFFGGFITGYTRVICKSEAYRYNDHMIALLIDGHEYHYYMEPYNMEAFVIKP
jgi:hypothetical protein